MSVSPPADENPPADDLVGPLLEGLIPADEDFAVQVVDRLLGLLVRLDGSDLHILPTALGADILVRQAGVLRRLGILPGEVRRVVARLKVLAGLLTYECERPQEGRLSLAGETETESPPNPPHAATGGHRLSTRLATCPTVFGEKAVLRRFDTARGLSTFADLGMPEVAENEWRVALARPAGLLLVTGPAGSGKTTTAYASLRQILADSPAPRSVVTLEDPVEQVLPGISQTAVGGNTPLSFADGLRAALRHDPEVLFVGELRDRETIETALRAALTGHLVLSTMHTGSAAEAVVRLFDAGVEPFLILSGLRSVLHQRLARGRDGERLLIAETLRTDTPANHEAVRRRADASGYDVQTPVRDQAETLLRDGRLDHTECVRLFGLDAPPE